MESKKLIFLVELFLLSITLVSIVSAEVSDAGVEYESKVLNEFNSGKYWVDIKVDLKDNSGIIINGTKDERRALLKQKYGWFVPVIDDVLSTLSKDEFSLLKKTTDGFRGKITKQGFDKLINDARIESIYYGIIPVSGTIDDKLFENQSEVRVIVELKDNSDIIVVGTKEERRNLLKQIDWWFEPVIEGVLSTLAEDEFELIRKSSNGFSGVITKKGFDKLTNDDRVSAIYLDVIVHATEFYNITTSNNISGVSNRGVEYDSELLRQFWVSDWVHVTVDIEDTTGITIPRKDSPDFESQISKRTMALSNISDSVLSTLSENEFKLEGRLINGRAFYGNITKNGFEKLLKDTRVRKIYAEKKIWGLTTKIIKNLSIYIAPVLLIFILIILLIRYGKKIKWKIKKLKR